MATELKLELTEGGVRAVPVSGEFVFVQVDGKWQVVGAVE